jgi:hypothetical protein
VSVSHSRDRATSNGALWYSGNADASLVVSKASSSKIDDIRLLQFIVDLNPLNKIVCDSLSQLAIRAMEEECWTRFRRLAGAQHDVFKLLSVLLPPETSALPRPSRIKPHSGKKGIRRYRSWFGTAARRRWNALDVASANMLKNTVAPDRPDWSKAEFKTSGDKTTVSPRRRLSVAASSARTQLPVSPSPKTELVATLMRMTRCNSLPALENDFFGASKRKTTPHNSPKGNCGIDFEILQRCQRPQYATQLHWYHLYRQWRHSPQTTAEPEGLATPAPTSNFGAKERRSHALSFIGDMRALGIRRLGRPRVAAMGSRLQLPSQRSLLSATTDLQSLQFIGRIKQVGKAWELVMLLVATYHLVVTPFKVSFAPTLIVVPERTLWKWSALEMFFDLLCFLDVVFKVRHCSGTHRGTLSATATSSHVGFQRALASSSELRSDVIALLPLELLLLASSIRVSISQSAMPPAEASWWAMRWLLRMNRVLLVRRIEPLSERLFQFAIHDLKLPVDEARLYFVRGLLSYLATGHILACIWYLTSEIGFHYYGTSWLATSGMLTYISTGASVVEHTRRKLSDGVVTFSIEAVPLARKYLRSLLFSMECISTLFYGDILSMNPLELVAEIAITLWSIYIYGALVGAQAELLEARASREAVFEQNLGELQHYVVQNGVPKALKRQIKAYYARLWRRCRGESDFAAVTSVSRVLYEDVVLTTLRHFAAQVKAFRGLEEPFLRALLPTLQYVVCDMGEEVVMKGDVDRSMYFIAQGIILVKLDACEVVRERGESFGELTLLYGISRLETCVALSVAELYRLDHEPYERLLLEFPEYRSRNKVAWTTIPEAPVPGPHSPQRPHTPLASRPSMTRIGTQTPQSIETQLPYSFVHRATMKMLAGMQDLHPLEAKSLILKCREGARKQLMRCATPENDEKSAHSDGSEGAHAAKRTVVDATVLQIFEKTRASRKANA